MEHAKRIGRSNKSRLSYLTRIFDRQSKDFLLAIAYAQGVKRVTVQFSRITRSCIWGRERLPRFALGAPNR